jgi:hypothetical protein
MIMAEIGAYAGIIIVTASVIGMAIWLGTRAINESAKDRSSMRDRPMVLPPPGVSA